MNKKGNDVLLRRKHRQKECVTANKEIKCKKCGSRMDIKPLDNSRGSVHCSFCGNIMFYERVPDSKIKQEP